MKACAAGIVLLLFSATVGAAQSCRHALALGLDVSGSVDAREYRLQLGGLAQALNSAAVRTVLLERPETPIEMLVYEWSGPQDDRLLLDWTRITDAAALDTVIAQLHATERRAQATPGTALGTAMVRGAAYLAQRPDCFRATLDLSGDGQNNFGPRPRSVKPQLASTGLTINALVIGADDVAFGDMRQSDISSLSAYFRAEVILGPNAFIEVALGFEDYARAMETKLLRELEGLVLSSR